MRLKNGGIGQLAITMSCPVDYRRGSCFGTNGAISWDIYSGDVTVQTAMLESRWLAGSKRLVASFQDAVAVAMDPVAFLRANVCVRCDTILNRLLSLGASVAL